MSELGAPPTSAEQGAGAVIGAGGAAQNSSHDCGYKQQRLESVPHVAPVDAPSYSRVASSISASQQGYGIHSRATSFPSAPSSPSILDELRQHRDPIPPIGSGCRKRIVKTHTQDDFPVPTERDRMITKCNAYYDDYKIIKKRNDNESLMETSSIIDFFAEGERMVSELCNISSERKCSATLSQKNTPHYQPETAERRESSEPTGVQIVRLAVAACTDAESIAVAHHHRPCFKNIHSICAKTRSNVQKPDSAVANLHSQGVPWVIKNLIFSFVRILDGWKGIKELLNEKHESFSKIENKYYSPNIRECFFEWQEATRDMLAHVYRTFKQLDTGFTLEQKSYTHNYYTTNPTAPRYQNKPQPLKMLSPSIMRPNPMVPQQYGTTSAWPTNNPQDCTKHFLGSQEWKTCSNLACRNMHSMQGTFQPPIHSVNDNTNLLKPTFPSSIAAAVPREAKMRQSWTMSNLNVFRNPSTPPDNREIPHQCTHHPQSELSSRAPSPFVKNLNYEFIHFKTGLSYENQQRGDMASAPKIIPLDHVEKNMQSAPSTGFDLNSWFGFKNNSCGDTKEEFDLIGNWGQISKKDRNTSSTKIQFGEIEPEDFQDVSKVYMKPGSYKVPTIPPEPLNIYGKQSSTSTELGATRDDFISTETSSAGMKVPFPAAPIVPPPRHSLESCPYFLTRKGNNHFLNADTKFGIVSHDIGEKTSDEAWRAAKESAPKLLDALFVRDNSNLDSTQLCNAQHVYTGMPNENDLGNPMNNNKPSNTYENWMTANFSPSSAQRLDDIWNQNEIAKFNKMYENKETEHKSVPDTPKQSTADSYSTESLQSNSQGTNRIITVSVGKEHQGSQRNSCENSFCDRWGEESREALTGKEVREARPNDENPTGSAKKSSKPKNNAATVWYCSRKRRTLSAAAIKKFETIVHSLSKMDFSHIIRCNNMDLTIAPAFLDVVKNPICLNDITNKLKNVVYSDTDQVLHDFRRIFSNVRLYLKSFPDSTVKKKINKLAAEFEKMFAEEFPKWELKQGKNDRQIEGTSDQITPEETCFKDSAGDHSPV